MAHGEAQRRWILDGEPVPDDWPRLTPCPSGLPCWGTGHDDGVCPTPTPRGRKKIVPTKHYQNLIAAFAASGESVAEVAFDHTTHTANGVRTVLALQCHPLYPTLRVVQRGGSVFLAKPLNDTEPLLPASPVTITVRRTVGR